VGISPCNRPSGTSGTDYYIYSIKSSVVDKPTAKARNYTRPSAMNYSIEPEVATHLCAPYPAVSAQVFRDHTQATNIARRPLSQSKNSIERKTPVQQVPILGSNNPLIGPIRIGTPTLLVPLEFGAPVPGTIHKGFTLLQTVCLLLCAEPRRAKL
jgi:hypothetical protein